MPKCSICNKTVKRTFLCKECGCRFCEKCGDVDIEMCNDCKEFDIKGHALEEADIRDEIQEMEQEVD